MRIRICNLLREHLGDVMIEDDQHRPDNIELTVDGYPQIVPLRWDERIIDDKGVLHGCPVCGCREIFKRRDFPQKLGMAIVIVSALTSIIFYALELVLLSMGVLLAAVFLDALIFTRTKECLVCYRCRSEFRETPIVEKVHEDFDLAIGEKYRPVRQAGALDNGRSSSSSQHHL